MASLNPKIKGQHLNVQKEVETLAIFSHWFIGCTPIVQVNVMDTLSRLSHDTDSEVAMVR